MKRPGQFAVSAGFLLLSVWVTWPLLLHLDEALPGDLGDPLLNTWILGWDADRLRHGLAGLWNAPIFFPYRNTLAFSEHLLGIGVPVAPIVWLTGRPFVAYNVAFVASFALAAIGMWRLARRLTAREDAAILAGAIFAFAPARLGQIGHLQVLMSGWMPLALLGLHTYFETGSRLALAAFTVAFIVQGLSNGYYVYFLAVPAAIIALHALATRAHDRRRIAVGLAVSALCILVTFAPIALVYLDVRQTYGLQRSEDEVATFGADLGAYLHGNEALRPPIRIWRALPHYDKPGGPEGEVFPGIAAIALAIAALWPRRRTPPAPGERSRVVPLYAAIGTAALVLSMGADPAVWGVRVPVGAVYRWLFAHVPGFNGLRVPARFSIVVLLALAVLASIGFARIVSGVRPRARIAACAAALAIILLEGSGGAMPLAFLTPHGRPDRAAYAWVRDEGAGAVLELPAGELDTTFRTFQVPNTRRCFITVPSSTVRAATTRRSRCSWAAPRHRSSKPTISPTGCARCGRPAWARSSCIPRRFRTRLPARRSSSGSNASWLPAGTARWSPRPCFPASSSTVCRSGVTSPVQAATPEARPDGQFRLHALSPRRATPPIVWSVRSTATSRHDGSRASGNPAPNG